jgi:hypothetical protein
MQGHGVVGEAIAVVPPGDTIGYSDDESLESRAPATVRRGQRGIRVRRARITEMTVAPYPMRAPAPGLDARGPYLSRLSARSALYTDLSVLLRMVNGASDRDALRSLVVTDNVLTRPSSAARAKLWQELKTRYVLDPEHPLFATFQREWSRCEGESERALTSYVLLALNDRLVADLGTEWLYPLLRSAPRELRVSDVLAFLDRSADAHPEVERWTAETRLAVAQKYVASVRDFGLAAGRARKITVRPALYGAPVRLLVAVLRLAGVKDERILLSRVFRLLAIAEEEVVDALSELHRVGALNFRMQAGVIELETDSRP